MPRQDKKDVRGKVYLVTGGGMGMGKETAKLFAADGAKIVLWDVNEAVVSKTAAELAGKGAQVMYDVVDVTDRERVYEAAERVKKEYGKVDILHNNAGIVKCDYFVNLDDESLFKTVDVNFNAHMWTMKAFLPEMIQADDGHIINVASAAGLSYMPFGAAYCGSKAAVINFTDAMRLEMKKMKKKGVGFTTICPSLVKTGMFEGSKPPILLPWLTPEKMAGKIYQGYHKNLNIVCEPLLVKSIPALKGLLPIPVWDSISQILGIGKMLANWCGH